MLIPPKEAELFINLYPSLIAFAAGSIGGVEGIKDVKSFQNATNKARMTARGELLKNISLIDKFIDVNPNGFKENELGVVLQWKRYVSGTFYVYRDLKSYTVFLDSSSPPKAYGVLGIFSEIVDILPYPLPVMVEAVLLPWNGEIICDGILSSYNIFFGGGIKRSLKEDYDEAKSRGIITSLNPEWKPEFVKKESAIPKTPAVSRLLKRCPKTVKEFKSEYGEPKRIISGMEAKSCGVWNIDGKPVFESEMILLYPNIIKDKTLYLYVVDDDIIKIMAVEMIIWNKKDFRPHPGKSILK